jgi:polyisoprenoid-binding protein YceI
MKKSIFILSLAAVFAACNNQEATQASDQAAVSTDSTGINYAIDTIGSVIGWDSKKIVGGHNGGIRLSSGSLNIKDGNIVSGGFVVNMNTITNADLPNDKDSLNYHLVGHLMSPDFFDVAKCPTAKFDVTNVTVLSNDAAGNTHTISGNLTVKDSVKNISFPAKVAINGDELTATATVVINRLDFGIKYNSVSASPAALLKKLGDNAIKDELTISINLKAKKG